MDRLGPKCDHCGRCAFRASTDWRTLAVARVSAVHGGDVICSHCGKLVRLTPQTDWISLD